MQANLITRDFKDLLNEKGMTKTQLAGRLGLHLSTVCNYEKGRRKPKLPTIVKMAQILDITISEAVVIFLDKNIS